ncbi:MAG: FHA domain-containing protein [Anaerolineaceae bacterium]
MDIFNLLRIISFQEPEPSIEPTVIMQPTVAVTQATSGIIFKIHEMTKIPMVYIVLGLIAIALAALLVLLILIFSLSRKSKKKKVKPMTMARPPVTKPASANRKLPAEQEPDTTPPQENVGFGLQIILPDGKVVPLSALPATIGRGSGNTVVLNSEAVSTIHASIYYDSTLQAVCIEDQNSLNGTRVNGKPTRKNILNSDDKISIGDITLTFKDTGYIPS